MQSLLSSRDEEEEARDNNVDGDGKEEKNDREPHRFSPSSSSRSYYAFHICYGCCMSEDLMLASRITREKHIGSVGNFAKQRSRRWGHKSFWWQTTHASHSF